MGTFIPVELLCCNCSPVCRLLIQWVYDLILSQLCPSNRRTMTSPLTLVVGYFFCQVPELTLLMTVQQLVVISVFL